MKIANNNQTDLVKIIDIYKTKDYYKKRNEEFAKFLIRMKALQEATKKDYEFLYFNNYYITTNKCFYGT